MYCPFLCVDSQLRFVRPAGGISVRMRICQATFVGSLCQWELANRTTRLIRLGPRTHNYLGPSSALRVATTRQTTSARSTSAKRQVWVPVASDSFDPMGRLSIMCCQPASDSFYRSVGLSVTPFLNRGIHEHLQLPLCSSISSPTQTTFQLILAKNG